MSTRNNTPQGTTAGDDGRDLQARIAAMVGHLRPHAVSHAGAFNSSLGVGMAYSCP